MYNRYGYKIEEELGIDYIVDYVSRKLSVTASTSEKIISMNTDDFLKSVSEASKTATEIHAALDELNDMLQIEIITEEGDVTYCLVVPRTPVNEKEQLILTIVDGGQEAMDQLAKSLSQDEELKTEVPLEESLVVEDDYSDDELEGLAQELDKMAQVVANNPKEAYAIEVAAHTIRELKG